MATAEAKSPKGLLITPTQPAPFLVTKEPVGRSWYHHALVEVEKHYVDAMTGSPGHESRSYLKQFFDFVEKLEMRETDVFAVDPGIEDDP